MAERSLDIILSAKGAGNVAASFAAVRGSLGGMASELIGFGAIAANGPLAVLTGIIDGAREMVRAVAEGDTSMADLAASLKLAGDATASTLGPLKEYAEQIEKTTTLNHNAVQEAMSLGASMGGFVGKQLEEVTRAAVGLSARLQVDLKSAMELVVKGGEGYTSTLQRHGIVLNQSATAQEKFNQLLRIGSDAFSLAEAKAKTMSGGWERLKNEMGTAAEKIAGGIAGPLASAINGLSDGIEYLESHLPSVSEFFGPILDQAEETFAAIKQAIVDAIGEDNWKGAMDAAKEFIGLIRSLVPSFEEMKEAAIASLATIEYALKHIHDGSIAGLTDFVNQRLDEAAARAKAIAASAAAGNDSEAMNRTKGVPDEDGKKGTPQEKKKEWRPRFIEATESESAQYGGLAKIAEMQMSLLGGATNPAERSNQIAQDGWAWLKSTLPVIVKGSSNASGGAGSAAPATAKKAAKDGYDQYLDKVAESRKYAGTVGSQEYSVDSHGQRQPYTAAHPRPGAAMEMHSDYGRYKELAVKQAMLDPKVVTHLQSIDASLKAIASKTGTAPQSVFGR